MRFLYSMGLFLFSLVYLPLFIMKGKLKGGFKERFGNLTTEQKQFFKNKKIFWLHGVSVGEVGLALRLAALLRQEEKDVTFLITTTTMAGKDVALKSKNSRDIVLFFPFDFRFCVKRFLNAVQPKILILLETEIWPNLIWELSKQNIPCALVNARISDKAWPKYLKVSSLIKHVLSFVPAIGVQDESMYQRFEALGAPRKNLAITGNMKYDWKPDVELEKKARNLFKDFKKEGEFLLIAGSTHAGEEKILFEALKSMKSRHLNFKLLVAPRHLNRLPSIEQLAADCGLISKRFSRANFVAEDIVSESKTVYLLDAMGVLAFMYAYADAVFIGGSLVNIGGHNPVEAAYYSKPLIFGSFMQNFKEIAFEFQKAGAVSEVSDEKSLVDALLKLIENPSQCAEAGHSAKAVVSRHEGAAARNIQQLINPLIIRYNVR